MCGIRITYTPEGVPYFHSKAKNSPFYKQIKIFMEIDDEPDRQLRSLDWQPMLIKKCPSLMSNDFQGQDSESRR